MQSDRSNSGGMALDRGWGIVAHNCDTCNRPTWTLGASPDRSARIGPSKISIGRRESVCRGSGGAFFLVTLVLGWQQIQSTQEQLEVARQGQITERFTRAIDQLGSFEPTTRVGGVFALESIARDSPRNRQAVLEVLASFIRQRPHPTPNAALRDWKASRGMNPSADVEAAAIAIGRRDRGGRD